MNFFVVCYSVIADSIDVSKAERKRKKAERKARELEEAKILKELEELKVDESNREMLSKFCPHMKDKCRSDCSHFASAMYIDGGIDYNGRQMNIFSKARCKLEK